ncbi:MAG: cyclase [Chloroflexota bacterium]
MNTDIKEEIISLLSRLGPGKMSPSAYDTAWVARLGDIDPELSGRALEWLCQHQLPDGSWGAEQPFYYHDRVISTLSAMIALASQKNRRSLRRQIEKGLVALEWITERATKGLLADPNGATVGFEMIVPTLVAEAEKLGLIKQQGERILGRIARLRQEKLAKIEDQKINRYVTMAFSAEMAGVDGQRILEVDDLQDPDGSVACSPSATAYFIHYLRPGDSKALDYLRTWVSKDGGTPTFAPIDVFETAWTLSNLALIPKLPATVRTVIQTHLEKLIRHWSPTKGIGTAYAGTLKDCDDTAMVFDVLTRFGYAADLQAILHYEEEERFRCFSHEVDPSVSANIHALAALRQVKFDEMHPTVQKVLGFLQKSRMPQGFWFDKWHASPYYATSHAILACAGLVDAHCQDAVRWILDTQNPDGSWGFYDFPTAEETAYSLQALMSYIMSGKQVPKNSIARGVDWLEHHRREAHPTLWIGKALYRPDSVVESAVLSALASSKAIL